MSLHCPNKKSTLYKLLKQLNGGNEGLATHYYDEVNRLQDLGVISSKRFEAKESGKMYYSIPKIITEKSVSDNMRGKKDGVFTKNEAAFVELERQLIERDIDWIKITETPKAYRIELVSGVETDAVGQTKMFQKLSPEEENKRVATESSIRDLAARMADRIGTQNIRFISDRTQEFKGYNERGEVVINLAYATLDTPIHEILGHPIIRAIKNRKHFDGSIDRYNDAMVEFEDKNPNATREEAIAYADRKVGNNQTDLYQNLLKELETGKGKEVLDRIKRDYKYKTINNEAPNINDSVYMSEENQYEPLYTSEEDFNYDLNTKTYTLEEQQEEAIVTLLGELTADKLDKVKDKKLIYWLRQLLKEMSAYLRSLFNSKEIEIDNLKADMTLDELSTLLAYSNSKIILPGSKVEYQTPDGNKFTSYQEASNHISELAKSVKDVDLNNVKTQQNNLADLIGEEVEVGDKGKAIITKVVDLKDGFIKFYTEKGNFIEPNGYTDLNNFIQRNKEYEQSKEIIEEWKKINNIQYNPEEVYSRGQGFYSSIGAYSTVELDLLLQNLLQHIEDNKKAGGEFTISAFTKPIDKRINHLEKESSVRFVIYPKSEHIKWAAPTDVYSGSVWDASEKVTKDKKSELLGVSFTKAPSLQNVNQVSPNLSSIIDSLSHHHNELGIELTTNNFRLEVDENVPYEIKKLVKNINNILDSKYGKLEKPDTSKKILKSEKIYEVRWKSTGGVIIRTTDLNKAKAEMQGVYTDSEGNELKPEDVIELVEGNPIEQIGIQPTQTNETLKESIDTVKNKVVAIISETNINNGESFQYDGWEYLYENNADNEEGEYQERFGKRKIGEKTGLQSITKLEFEETKDEFIKSKPNKKYTSQALINTKIAALKEVAKKYPRSLITSKVVAVSQNNEREFSKLNPDESEETEAKPKSTKFSKAELFLKYRIKKLRSDMKNYPEDSLPYNTKKAEADTLEAQLDELVKSPTIEGYEEVGKKIILDAAEYINKADNQDDPITKERWLNYIKDIINTWGNFTELKTLVGRLDDRLQISIRKLLVDRVNKHSTEKAPISIEKINSQDRDVSWWTHGTGSLSDLANYVAKTIGLEIRFAQNKVATENIKDKERIQKEVDLLDEYAKKNGVDVDALWDIFIIERAETTELVREYNADNTENENWNKIHSTPELARFYKFYQDLIIEKEDASVFIEGGKYFIPNIQAKSVKGWFKSFDPRKTRQIGEGFEEDLSLDLVPLKLHKKIPAKNKNKDLGVALLQFSMFANSHKEMSEILPGLRLLQESLKYNEEDPTKQKQFRTSNDPNSKIDADKTNLWKMIDEVIKMQVIGEMKKDEGKRVYHTEYDNEGNVISEDYIDFRQVGDDLLKYNSLYRIGFSPIGALANLLFGDISNTLEAIGGRFFNFKQLLQASRIFSSQARKEDSALATLHKELNFLQELDDYQYLEEVRLTGKTKGVTGEKLQEMAYSLQKGGENWIQSRVALAIAIHDGYINTKGELTQKYKDASLQEKQKLSDKIQGVNHMNHGRYSAKEAAIWHQNFLFRAASQFRKWIPAAIENRFGEYNPHNNRLQAATEGRYNTLGRTVLKQLIKNPRVALDNMFLPLISAQKAIAKKQAAIKGTPTEQQLEDIRMEVYNMRKMTAEILLTIATVLIFKGLKGDDDDKEWRKNPFVKTALILTNRIAGDLQFFYDPTSITTIAGGIAPVNKLLIDVGKTISYTQYAFYVGDYKIKYGNFKDYNKFYKSFTGIAIGGNHYQDIFNKIMGKEELPEYRPTK